MSCLPSSEKERLLIEITCPICKELFNPNEKKPAVLDCGHSLCIECINEMKTNGHVQCPLDRTLFLEFSVIRINFGLMSIAENVKPAENDETTRLNDAFIEVEPTETIHE
jgi:hypothetical protein